MYFLMYLGANKEYIIDCHDIISKDYRIPEMKLISHSARSSRDKDFTVVRLDVLPGKDIKKAEINKLAKDKKYKVFLFATMSDDTEGSEKENNQRQVVSFKLTRIGYKKANKPEKPVDGKSFIK